VAFVIRDLVSPRYPNQLVVLHAAVLAWLVASPIALTKGWQPSLRQLRMLEFLIFGSVAAFFITSQWLGLQAQLRHDQLTVEELRVLLKASIISTLIIIFTYGIFIPNTARRAAFFIVPLALVPLIAPLLMELTSPAFRAFAEKAHTPEKLTENTLYLALGAITAVFGTHTINKFRTEAFRARRLNQYRLTRKLGSGGMGEVHLAEHQLLKRPCAIKLIRQGLSQMPRVLARFELEVRATARLSHWNTVEVFDYGRTEDGTFYYVMEYLPGLSLQELVDRHGPLPASRIIYLLAPACDALREAHEAGLIHRDLKPPNIFAAYRGARYDVAKLLDFGLVKPTKEDSPILTREGTVTGSPLYMAPEQITRSGPPDARTDIYAMGAIAYFLLCGRPPFLGSDSMAVMVAHARDPVLPPSQHRAGVPADLEQIIMRCLAKDPDERFQNAAELARALLSCADAGGWSAEQAEAWWKEHEPQACASPIASAVAQAMPEAVDLTQTEDAHLTLGASELERVAKPGPSVQADLFLTVGEDQTDREW
ncbi:MAG: serine/threonine protein kinase, partial [Planctomycetaceae bacterium]|nr:serine/threonine protein kinase [Planctomycetaceae bacterium]